METTTMDPSTVTGRTEVPDSTHILTSPTNLLKSQVPHRTYDFKIHSPLIGLFLKLHFRSRCRVYRPADRLISETPKPGVLRRRIRPLPSNNKTTSLLAVSLTPTPPTWTMAPLHIVWSFGERQPLKVQTMRNASLLSAAMQSRFPAACHQSTMASSGFFNLAQASTKALQVRGEFLCS